MFISLLVTDANEEMGLVHITLPLTQLCEERRGIREALYRGVELSLITRHESAPYLGKVQVLLGLSMVQWAQPREE